MVKLLYVALLAFTLLPAGVHAQQLAATVAPPIPTLLPLADIQYLPEAIPADGMAPGKAQEEEPTVRPFITDDARVVGERLAQIETWFRIDKESGQQWVMAAYGPNDKLELTLGAVAGYERSHNSKALFSYALPLLQAKYLFKPYGHGKGPGLGLVMGSFLPMGKGGFKPPGFGTFSFATISQCFGANEDLLLHLNVGLNYLHVNKEHELLRTWGFGTQVRTIGGMHLVGEIFSGDPYVPGAGTSWQAGFRHFFSDLLQIDMTCGKGISGANPLPFWASGGVRIVLERWQKKHHGRQ
ncbi:MAG TPA: hypothetical protein PKD90_00630 [Phnomibacter sp.]|nr:hypothetical protein [Phnomibacter sp.]